MSRPPVRVCVARFSATLAGPGASAAVKLAGVRSMRHPTRKGALQVPRVDLDEVLAALQLDRRPVLVVDDERDLVAVVEQPAPRPRRGRLW